MSSILTRLSETIVDVARYEDLLLRRVGKGIFHMREPAFVHAVGRRIASKASDIFGTSEVFWLSEKRLGDAGITDLAFEVKGQRIFVFEFKFGAIDSAFYVDDLRKLATLDPVRHERIFCGLICTYPANISTNPYIVAVQESGIAEPLVKDFDFFSTLFDFKNQVCCVVGLWRVLPKPISPAG